MNKSDLALIHGWGLGSGVWQTCAGQLESVARIHHVDLPGYGDTPDHGETFIEAAQSALEALPDGVTLCGWSLGGLIGHAIAAQLQALGERVELLAMMDSYPFVADTGEANEAQQAQAVLKFLGFHQRARDNPPQDMRSLADLLCQEYEVF